MNADKKHYEELTKTKLDFLTNTCNHSLNKVTEFDTNVINANNDYLIKISESGSKEADMLIENMKLAESPEERKEIRERFKEIRKENFEKDTENKQFYKEQQSQHKNYADWIVVSTAGLLYGIRKPLIEGGIKKLFLK